MDIMGAMNSLRDEAALTMRAHKAASARRSDEQASENGGFNEVLAGIGVVPFNPVTQQTAVPAGSSQTLDATSSEVKAPTNALPAPSPAEHDMASNETKNSNTGLRTDASAAADANSKSVPVPASEAPATANTARMTNIETQPPASLTTGALTAVSPGIAGTDGQGDADSLLAQLTALATEEGAQVQNASPNMTTTAAALSAGRSNAGLASALRNNSALDTETAGSSTGSNTGANSGATVTTSSSAASNAVVPSENGTANGAQKGKPVALEVAIKSTIQTSEPISTTLDGAGSTSIINGTEVATPANDLASRAPQLTPHTIPMLAATMMRRLESGARQFTMRLDPPELGQVEVKLTVAADKKVRAVVSADRPEALADLVRSARDLARALLEAGLDLDENGLTFTLNDPSSGGQQQQARDQHNALFGERAPRTSALADIAITPPADKLPTRSDPFQSWQRARIALTA